MKTLDQIGIETGTDRSSAGWHSYLTTYDELLGHLRHEPIRMIEMGALRFEGVRMWLQYFDHPSAQVVTIDICDWGVPPPNDPRLLFRKGSQDDEAFMATLPSAYDLIIDDAGHFDSAQIKCFGFMWPKVNPGGLYVIEDLHSAFDKVFHTGPTTITQFVHQIEDEMQDHRGAVAQARPDPTYRWDEMDWVLVRKGMAIFKKRS